MGIKIIKEDRNLKCRIKRIRRRDQSELHNCTKYY